MKNEVSVPSRRATTYYPTEPEEPEESVSSAPAQSSLAARRGTAYFSAATGAPETTGDFNMSCIQLQWPIVSIIFTVFFTMRRAGGTTTKSPRHMQPNLSAGNDDDDDSPSGENKSW